ncbi:MAG: hypothetical protein JSW50_10835 [Candidatus Latescibacterota bacterium]|nr:MAG: hypothetical protein JSW50_10835 [Candidatus Latescibacterota bacterium]
MAQYDKVIPPGQEGTITLEIDGKKVSGPFNKRATVKTNDPRHPQMTIALAGKIMAYVDIKPTSRVYLSGMYGEQVTKELTVTSNDMKKDFEILELKSNIDDKITYKLIPDAEPGKYTVKLWKNPKLPTLHTWGSLFIETNSEHSPQKVVQINVATRGSIVCQPSTVNFGAVRFAEESQTSLSPSEKTLTIFKVNGEFQIRDVEFSSQGYKAEIEPVEDGKRYKIIVHFSPEEKKKQYHDEMIINTDDPNEPSVRVRLIARGVGT